jgi:C-terminal processing protease CtpA/Prc
MRVEVDSTGDAVVGAIYKDSPAWEAGLRKGDQITAIDGNPVSQDLVNATRRKISSGELKSVRLSVLRDKASFDVVVRPLDYIQ